jgi:hypothetical protein
LKIIFDAFFEGLNIENLTVDLYFRGGGGGQLILPTVSMEAHLL